MGLEDGRWKGKQRDQEVGLKYVDIPVIFLSARMSLLGSGWAMFRWETRPSLVNQKLGDIHR